MKQMIENACGFLGALIRNIFVIILAAVLLIVFGASRIMELSRELEACDARISSMSIEIREKDIVIAEKEDEIIRLDKEIDILNQKIAEISPAPSAAIRQEIWFMGCIRLGENAFICNVSPDVFDSLSEGDEISAAEWLGEAPASGLIRIRSFVIEKIEA